MTVAFPKPIGSWTALKLEQLDHYLQAYRRATKKIAEAYYIDLFAGCGQCVVKKTGWPVEGSPLRALRAAPPFARCFFVEKDSRLAAHLRAVISQTGLGRCEVHEGDCNGPVLDKVLSNIPRHSLSFAFLDPSGLQLHWATVQTLALHRLGQRKMELLILFPYDMAIKRWLTVPSMADALSRIFGGDSWREALQQSITERDDKAARRQRFVDLYSGMLKALGYKYVDAVGPLGYGQRYYYNVIFATDEPIGQKIMQDIWAKPRAIPGQLFYTPVRRPN